MLSQYPLGGVLLAHATVGKGSADVLFPRSRMGIVLVRSCARSYIMERRSIVISYPDTTMKIRVGDQRTLLDFIEGRISLRKAQQKLKVSSMSMVYIRGFHLLKQLYEGKR
jgi:hypothetical protein